MHVKEDSYILGIWFLAWGTGDWMGTVYRNKEGKFQMEYRFRYYEGEDVWDGKDKKSWYKGATDERDESVIIDKLNSFMSLMEKARPEKCSSEVLLIRGGSKKFMKAIKGKHWIHVKSEAIN